MIQKDPRNAKVALAKKIVTWLHDASAVEAAEHDFTQKFVKKEVPDEMPEISVGESKIGILNLITQVAKFAFSNSEAWRLVEGNAVSLDGEVVTDVHAVVWISGKGQVLKVGKRKFAKIF